MLSTQYRLRLTAICKDIGAGVEVSLEDMIWAEKLAKADGDLTFLYYPSLFWEHNMEGHLMFLDNNGEGDRIITHKPNRGILFPGSLWHYAAAPSRYFVGLRISLAYKLWI